MVEKNEMTELGAIDIACPPGTLSWTKECQSDSGLPSTLLSTRMMEARHMILTTSASISGTHQSDHQMRASLDWGDDPAPPMEGGIAFFSSMPVG
jgi:hypothetical protein